MQILQLSTALPKDRYSTEELIQAFPCKLPEGVRQNVLNLGVSNRYLLNPSTISAKTENVSNENRLANLCSVACEKAIKEAGLTVKDMSFLIATYDANPFLSPGLSYFLVPKLGLDPYVKHVNAQGIASTAFPKALDLAQNYLAVHPEDHVLVCISGVSSFWFQNQVHGIEEVMEVSKISQIRDEAMRSMELQKWIATMQFFLFGDGVAAVVVAKKGKGAVVKRIVEVTNLREKHCLAGYSRLAALDQPFKFGFFSYLDKEIPKLGSEYAGLVLEKLLGKNAESTIKSARKWAVHTGSEKILNLLAEKQGIERERLEESYFVLREYGNLAGASLPFILEKIFSGGRLTEGDVVLMVGYGWGFTAAACLLENM